MTLEHLNSLRAQLDMKPLKSWKESKAKLVVAIATLEEAIAREKQVTPVTITPEGNITPEPVKTKATKAKSTLAEFLKEHDINPRVARAKLRRHKFSAPYVLDEKMKAILLGDARKK